MLKGDLISTPLPQLLLQLAADAATGCLHVSDADADEALVYFRAGDVYAVTVPGRRPQLGAKLVSSGVLTPEALAEAVEAQRTELQGWKLSELLVHLGYVDQPIVEDFVREQLHDGLWELVRWTDGRWRFRKNEKTREDVAPPMPVAELLETLRDRGVDWEAISTVVSGPTAVPTLSTGGGAAGETTLDPDAWSMLCKIDGDRSVAELARDCGYTLFEAGRVLVSLVDAGLVDIDSTEPPPAEVDAPYGATSISSALAADIAIPAQASEEDGFAALARLATEVAGGVADDEVVEEERTFAASLARVSEALSSALGEPADADAGALHVDRRIRVGERAPAPEFEGDRRRRNRDAAAAELAAAHALAEALRQEDGRATDDDTESDAVVVDLAQVRRDAEETARLEAERREAERAAAEEAARLEAERLESERLAAEEAARLEAARQEAARVEAERLEAERLAAEEAARLEAERLESERLAAEEAARLEAERLETERLAAEHAARLEAERLAAEEAARREAERLEAERAAAEQAARLEAERVAAQEAARLEAERLEAERAAAEHAARLEAERLEAERLAAEEAERLQAERLAAEEAARLDAERAAAEEAARLETERLADRAAEAERVEDAQRAAAALLVDLSREPAAEPVEPAAAPAADEFFAEPAAQASTTLSMTTMPFSEATDTAALLRELSSLGLEDEPSQPSRPGPPRAPRATPPPVDPKKKKRGLFGR